jgi:hypothetical protein
MKIPTLLLLSIMALSVQGFAQNAPPSVGLPANDPDGSQIGIAAARATYRAARAEAHADFWISVANGLNGPWEEVPARMLEARAELLEALQFAADQFNARLLAQQELGDGPYDPRIIPSEFTTSVDNPYMPLLPGRTLVYEKQTPEGFERKEVTTLHRTLEVNGIECRMVREYETFNGKLVEDTINWYAQHSSGDVWYFGEVAKQYEDGILDNLDGSWRFGKDGAKPGIVMLSTPEPGDVYRQEFAINVTEDVARVVACNLAITIPFDTLSNCVKTFEWSPLEPDEFTEKYYSPDLGLVMEVDVQTGESLVLVEIVN